MQEETLLFLPQLRLQALLDTLQSNGYTCIGPQVRDATIVYDVLQYAKALPWGVREYQAPGEYRLESSDVNKAFAWANGPQAIKPILFKPKETIWRVVRTEKGTLEFQPEPAQEKPVAIIGARACDLAAMRIQDQVFLEKGHIDKRYQNRRANLFVVAVNCTYASQNCFCVSAGTGPKAQHSFDLLLTEVKKGFVIRSGSDLGQGILDDLQLSPAKPSQLQAAEQGVQHAADMQTKRIPLDNQVALRDTLFSNLGHPRWEDVAERCLSCGNCTAVCPTCFCHSEADKPSLDGMSSAHQRQWDSCFTAEHSELGKKPIRETTSQRYRQWLTHKVGSWFDQFGTSGCVGCGRCVTWCPVGIDMTEELSAISGESNVRSDLD